MSADKSPSDKRLTTYLGKRAAASTPEPFGKDLLHRPGAFVVQKHAARNLHYDLRLELDGVLLSWAVPKGLSPSPSEKRLAVRTEDHPLDYLDFEGIIPEGNYGAGAMIVWDRGRWLAIEDPREGLETGKLLFELRGYKLGGVWTLVRTRKNAKEWLLIKKPDAWADAEGTTTFSERSVLSGLGVDELAAAPARVEEVRSLLADWGADRSSPDPAKFQPMLAETRKDAFSDPDWIFELKYDGFRILAVRRGELVQLRYRSGADATRLYPEIARALAALPLEGVALDGELVALDEEGKPNFQLLQRRAKRRRPLDIQAGTVELPVTLFAFDLLAFDDFDVRPIPLRKRKELLGSIVPRQGPIRLADHFEGTGLELYRQVVRLGLEGIVAKRGDSPYRGGKRSDDWLKIPAHRFACFVVVGYTEPKGGGPGFGALHLAAFDRGRLRYAGRVGTGFSQSEVVKVFEILETLRRTDPPCEGSWPEGSGHHWVEPRLVCEARFKEFTEQGHLRQPSFLRLKPETPMTACVLPLREKAGHSRLPGNRRPAVRLSNLDKVLWPETGYSKGDLIDYYDRISEWILPYLRDRLLVMDRYPDGIHGKSFFQKNVPGRVPDWVRTQQVWSEHETKGSNHLVCDSREALLYVANLASIPLHIWGSRVACLPRPDWCVLDLDPTEAPFPLVVEVALGIRELCDRMGAPSFVKTSGGKGLHILLPLGAAYGFEQARLLAELIARIVVHRLPGWATVERRLEDRHGKVYIDYLQNGYAKLLVSPFSVRPNRRALVSTPLDWAEVGNRLDPRDFDIATVPKRLKERGRDPLAPVFETKADLAVLLERLEEEIRKL
jgi:bifunctional non-homologous end joining protein LigD